MKVFLRDMMTHDVVEIEIPGHLQLVVQLRGTVLGPKTPKIITLDSETDDNGETLGLTADYGRIYSTATATNAWQIGISE